MASLHLTQAKLPLTHDVEVIDETGHRRRIWIPAERALTVYVDKRELITLMTLGQHPEWLVLGYLLNQRLVATPDDLASITVDWDVNAAAVQTHHPERDVRHQAQHRVITSGCGQGSTYSHVMDQLQELVLPATRIHRDQVQHIVATMRAQDSLYKKAGSVHGCALFAGSALQVFVEDVGRHNAVDTIAGWMALHRPIANDLVFYTTGRLTSEMVIKCAQMGVAVLISRSGMTQMGWLVAERLGLCALGRARHQHFLCFTAPERLQGLIAPGS